MLTNSLYDIQAILRNAELIESGILLRNLLTTIRHRGAFSAVYPAYVSLNVRLLDSTDAELNKLPARWLEVYIRYMFMRCNSNETIYLVRTIVFLSRIIWTVSHLATFPLQDGAPVFRCVSLQLLAATDPLANTCSIRP